MDGALAQITSLLRESAALAPTRPAEAAVRLQAALDLGKAQPALAPQVFRELSPRLGALYLSLADYAGARRVLTEALEHVQQTAADADADAALNLQNSLAAVRLMEGDFAGARDGFRAVLEARRAAVPPDLPEIARTLTNLSRACAELDLTADAHEAAEEAVRIMREHAPDGDDVLTAAVHNLAVAQLEAGCLEGAQHGFDRARRWAAAGGGERTPQFASILHELARVYGEMYRYDEAHAAAQECFVLRHQLLGDQHPDTARAYQTAGRLLRDSGNHARALLAFRSAYQSSLAIHGQGHPDTVNAMLDMMTAARRAPENDEVGSDLQDLVRLARRMGGAGNPLLFRTLTDLAAWLERTGDDAQVGALAAEAVAVFQTLDPGHDVSLAAHYVDLARVLERRHAASEALPLLARAAHADDPLVRRIAMSRDGTLRRALARRLAAGTADVVHLAVTSLSEDEGAAAAAFSLVASRKGLLAESFLSSRDRDLVERQPDLAPLFARLADLETELAATQMAGPLDGWRKLLTAVDRLSAQIRDLNAEIEFTTRYAHRIAPEIPAVTAGDVAAALAAGAALVECYALAALPAGEDDQARRMLERTGADEWLLPPSTPERYVAFVVHAGAAAPRLVELGPGADLERLVYSWLYAIGNGAGDLVPREREQDRLDGSEAELSRRLRAAVFDPMAAHLGDATTIHVAPDGVLCRVPFAALLDEGDPPARLIERFTFTVVPSSRVLTRGARPAGESGPPFVLGDPDYDLTKPGSPAPPPPSSGLDFYFNRLPGTADEAWRVSRRIGGRRVTSRQAHEGAIRALRSPAILHLATHGYYVRPFAEGLMIMGDWRQGGGSGFLARRQVLGFGANPFTRSGLVLAGANAWTRGDAVPANVGDGLFTAFELARLDLQATELVVLSACSTALGDVAPGTPVAGLLYALQVAGARTTVAAMWPIPDETTVAIMETLYDRALSGVACGEALRQAQLALVRRGDPPWRWAAHVCCGDPSPIRYRPAPDLQP